jgi:hypothetical protein
VLIAFSPRAAFKIKFCFSRSTSASCFGFSARATTASTVGASATVYSRQSIEGIELFSNKQVTVSFMVKSNASTTFQLRREYNYGSGGSSTQYDSFIDVPVTTSWTKFTHTYDAVDFSSKTIGSSNYYGIMFYWSTNQGSNTVRDGNIDITNVQIELGKVATPFEHRFTGEELALCQRYYQLNISNTAFTNSTTVARLGISGVVQMRAQPSLTIVDATGRVEDFGIANRNLVSLASFSPGGASGTMGGAVDATITSSSNQRSHILFAGSIGLDSEI